MTAYSKLTRDYEDYLVRLIFGPDLSLPACINLAYLDFNRTLRAVSKLENAKELHNRAVSILLEAFADLNVRLTRPINQTLFDVWHRAVCEKVIAVYPKTKSFFFGGQAQKWVNMTLKYVYTLGEDLIPGYQQAYPYCHAPLDNVVIDQLAKDGFPKLTAPWSQIGYDEYFERQKWLRQKFASIASLDVEFWLWLGKKIPPCASSPHQI